MDLLDVKIAEIKNINLIYLFSTDSIFTNEENNYLGLKVVYNNHRDYISIDFKDSHFPKLVKRTIERYNQEKDNRNIILLGTLTQRLLNEDDILKVSEDKGSYNDEGLTLFSTTSDKVSSFFPYIKEVVVDVLKQLPHHDSVIIDSIRAYNHKCIITYKIGKVKLELFCFLALEDAENLNFKISSINGKTGSSISGHITNSLNKVTTTWKNEEKNVMGLYKYDVINNYVEKKIYDSEKTLYYDEHSDTIIEEDEKLVKFYLQLFEVELKDSNFIKTSDYNYIFGHEENLIEDEENYFVQNHGVQLIISEDKVTLKYKIKNGLSKYNDRLNVDLDFDLFEITMTKVKFNDKEYILVERTNSNNYGKKYNYVVYDIENLNFLNPFDNSFEKIEINEKVESLYDIKKLLLSRNVQANDIENEGE